jgi:integrase
MGIMRKKNNHNRSEETRLSAPNMHQRKVNKYSPSDIKHWKLRVQKRKYESRQGEKEGSYYCVQICHQGKRRWFNTLKVEKEEAAKVARQFYLTLCSQGWDEALRKFNQGKSKKIEVPTVGDYLQEAQKSDLDPSTLAAYSSRFRTLVSEIMRIQSEKKHDHKNGGHKQWCKKVDLIPLMQLTVNKVQAWKRNRVLAVEGNPKKVSNAKRTVDCILRCSKALFSQKVRKHVSFEISEPFFTDGIDLYNEQPERYQTQIKSIHDLLKSAISELFVPIPEVDERAGKKRNSLALRVDAIHRRESLKILILAYSAGLRRFEIDILLWEQVDFHKAEIKVQPNKYGKLKTWNSTRTIQMNKDLAELLQELKGASEFVIESSSKPKTGLRYRRYRCDSHFKFLNKWLHGKGIKSVKAIHDLRKECGSVINEKYGIVAARNFLGHSNLNTTLMYYTDTRGECKMPDVARHMPKIGEADQQKPKKFGS